MSFGFPYIFVDFNFPEYIFIFHNKIILGYGTILGQYMKQHRIMKFILYVIMVFVLLSCKSTKPEAIPPFTVQEAFYNHWVGGKEGVSGIKLKIMYTSNQEVSFDRIYFQNREGIIETNEIDGKTFLIANVDTSTRNNGQELILDIDPKKEMTNKLPELKIPFELKENEAVVLYSFKGVLQHYKIKNIKKTQTEYYP
tara:strand:- start:1000 stop:1590 length:591 start_codon:yes stop_codon:yes gene_type:complete